MSYTGWLLPELDRAKLLQIIPPAYHDVIAHHVTIAMGIKDLPLETTGEIVAMGDDRLGCQALVVAINGSTIRPDGYNYHITWSLDRDFHNRKPFHSATMLQTTKWLSIEPIAIDLIPMVFND